MVSYFIKTTHCTFCSFISSTVFESQLLRGRFSGILNFILSYSLSLRTNLNIFHCMFHDWNDGSCKHIKWKYIQFDRRFLCINYVWQLLRPQVFKWRGFDSILATKKSVRLGNERFKGPYSPKMHRASR